tara:strand:+ start:74 stop:361 length:288 start_codon:yes stop_codon:yes gene_type:complete
MGQGLLLALERLLAKWEAGAFRFIGMTLTNYPTQSSLFKQLRIVLQKYKGASEMRLRELDFARVLKKIDEEVTDWNFMADLEEAYEIWDWHPGMG